MRKISIAALGATLAAVLTATAWQPASAQQSGDSVTILIPALENQPSPNPPPLPEAKLIYTGGRVTSVDTFGCATGVFPVQNAVLVDPSGGSGRIVGVITVSQTEPVPPGTRVGELSFEETCVTLLSGPTAYLRYSGRVE